MAVQSQYIMGPSGPVDINHMAIHAAMDLYGIKDRITCFKGVVSLGHAAIKDMMNRDNHG